MTSQHPGRQSPSPEKQSNNQRSSSSSGQCTDYKPDKRDPRLQLEPLESNPKPIMDEHLKESTKKWMPQKPD